jgi:hypothetical protein
LLDKFHKEFNELAIDILSLKENYISEAFKNSDSNSSYDVNLLFE